ncbi:hypothetical protein MDA_GLEAN10011296 [Myotis davidii]|uniref:Uncharacterized protein n=1 Tax=Myotis davidii TaxID=225400 RepID=L5ME11_MYODS|nr:hypothetical protein MDA_GLEAN10011296 [Myotis davidii]
MPPCSALCGLRRLLCSTQTPQSAAPSSQRETQGTSATAAASPSELWARRAELHAGEERQQESLAWMQPASQRKRDRKSKKHAGWSVPKITQDRQPQPLSSENPNGINAKQNKNNKKNSEKPTEPFISDCGRPRPEGVQPSMWKQDQCHRALPVCAGKQECWAPRKY